MLVESGGLSFLGWGRAFSMGTTRCGPSGRTHEGEGFTGVGGRTTLTSRSSAAGAAPIKAKARMRRALRRTRGRHAFGQAAAVVVALGAAVLAAAASPP